MALRHRTSALDRPGERMFTRRSDGFFASEPIGYPSSDTQ